MRLAKNPILWAIPFLLFILTATGVSGGTSGSDPITSIRPLVTGDDFPQLVLLGTRLPYGVSHGAAVFDPSTQKGYYLGGIVSVGAGDQVIELEVTETIENTSLRPETLLEARYSYSAAFDASQGRAYLIGGRRSGSVLADNIELFDTRGFTSTELVNLPTPARQDTASVLVPLRNLVYIIGGQSGLQALTDILAFDPATNSISTVAALPDGRASAAAVYVQESDQLYIFGGCEPFITPYGTMSCDAFNDVFALDLETHSISRIGALPAPRSSMSAIHVPSLRKVYLFGGYDWDGTGSIRFRDVIEYDLITDTSRTLDAQLPSERNGTAAFYVSATNKGYVLGGLNGGRLDQIVEVDFGPVGGGTIYLPFVVKTPLNFTFR